MSFPVTKLAEITEKIGSGVTPRGGDSVYVSEGTPLIRSQNVYNSQFNQGGLVFLDEKTAQKMKGVTVLADDILLNITGDSVARCCKADERFLPARVNQHVAIIRTKRDRLNPDFLMFYLTSPFMQTKMLSWAGSGGTRKALTKSMIEGFEVPTPDPDQQIRISGVLKSYNDLIENNKRRIGLLEASARQLYKEWFVRFRFPGHEHVKLIDGVPDGWQRLTLAECCEKSTYGFTASADIEPVGPKLLRITDIVPSSIDWPSVPYCLADEDTTNKYLLVKGDIVVARTGATVGYAKLMPELNEEVVYASYLVRFRPKTDIIDEQILGIFVESEGYKEHVRAHAGGAAQPNANAHVLGSAKLDVPPSTLQSHFKDFVEPIFKQKAFLEKSNFSLAKARDLLLPKLMSGEIAV